MDVPLSRRRVLQVLGAAATVTALPVWRAVPPAGGAGPLPIVDGGQARAAVLADAASAAMADELVAYVEKATGVRLPRTASPGQTVIHVGAPGPDPTVPALLAGLDPDGYLIHPHLGTIAVIGPSAVGTANGVRGFLERFLDIRWLLPGPDGEDVPARSTVAVPPALVRDAPAFLQRSLSPLRDNRFPIQRTWAERNRLQGVGTEPIAFHHNLHTLFPVETYGGHRDYYSTPEPPEPGDTTGWQPRFSVPATIDVAVDEIHKYFLVNPTARSISLGVNDGEGFFEADPVTAYYSWVNEVVRRVLVLHPDKTFGLLAYRKLETPPAFRLHERIVPFLTKDRYAWIDPTEHAAGQALTDRWLAVAGRLGFYDYLYGAPYLLPRVFPHRYAETLRYAAGKGVVAHYAEIYPNWGEGPKPWITARLQWDPNANVDQLLREWYERAVGTAAAPELAAYYDLWERFWVERVPRSAWFRAGATYQLFNQPEYMEVVEAADLDRSRELLDAAATLAVTPPQKARATTLRRTFDLFDAAAASYPKFVGVPADAAAAEALLRRGVDTFQRRLDDAVRRGQLIQEFARDPVLVLPWNPATVPNLNWSGWNPSEFWSLVEYLRVREPAGGPVTDRARQLSTDHPTAGGRGYAALLLRGVPEPQRLVNPSFETGTTDAPPWRRLDRSSGTRAIARMAGAGATGPGFLRVSGSGWGGPAQLLDLDPRPEPVAAQPHLVALRAVYRAPAGTKASVQLAVDLIGANGRMIPGGSVRGLVTYLQGTGAWLPLRLDAEVPAKVGTAEVKQVDVVFLVDSVGDIEVDLDDVSLLAIPKVLP